MPELTVEQLWIMVNRGVEAAKEKEARLQMAEDRISKLRQLIPQEVKLPQPQELPALLQGLREALWDSAEAKH